MLLGYVCPDMMAGYVLRVLVALVAVTITGSYGLCNFPELLWRDTHNSNFSQRTWITESKYLTNTATWESRLKIVANVSTYAIYREYRWVCDVDEAKPYYSDTGRQLRPCVMNERISRVTCLEIEQREIYKVKISGRGPSSKISCIKFVERTGEILEIFSAKPEYGQLNCTAVNLVREEWPWIAENILRNSYCPVVGGFDFTAFVNGNNRSKCPRVWRPSRLESECILGEGLHFLFPEAGCSIFPESPVAQTLLCVGSWTVDGYLFVLAMDSRRDNSPQYILRLMSSDGVLQSTSRAVLYLSPVAPTTASGAPPRDIMFASLNMQPSDPARCFDESKLCEVFVDDGKCDTGRFHYYGNFCKKSCGFCNLAPLPYAECYLPSNIEGEWVMFDSTHKEIVTISSGTIAFSQRGQYICKSTHWKNNFYKVLSLFQNGCRPKYSCIDLEYSQERDTLTLKMSSTYYQDFSFEMCNFDSTSSKLTLYRRTHVTMFDCALGGQTELAGIVNGDNECKATLTDWNPHKCAIVPSLSLSFYECETMTLVKREFTCEVQINLQDYKILLTKEVTNSSKYTTSFQCWLIRLRTRNTSTTLQKGGGGTQWRQVYMLRSEECGVSNTSLYAASAPTEAIFRVISQKEAQTLECKKDNKAITSVLPKYSFPPSTFHVSQPDRSIGYLQETLENTDRYSRASHHQLSYFIIIINLLFNLCFL